MARAPRDLGMNLHLQEIAAIVSPGAHATFDDLVRLDAAGIQVLLRQVDKDQLGLALKGAAEDA